MTRDEFDRAFRARADNTAGYRRAVLEAINDSVFAQVSGLDLLDLDTKSIVDHAFTQAFAAVG